MIVQSEVLAVSFARLDDLVTKVVLELRNGQTVELAIHNDRVDAYRETIRPGCMFTMETHEEPQWVMGKAPHVPG